MGAIGAFLSLLFLLPTIGIALLIGYVLKKSFAKPTPGALLTEKAKMEEKVKQLSRELSKDDVFDVTQITNNISRSWIKSFTRKDTGHVLTMQNEPLIAYQRTESGWGGNNLKIMASSNSFSIEYEMKNKELIVFYNSSYLGKVDALHNLRNAENKIIGKANRFTLSSKEPETYPFFFENVHIADLAICYDMRTIQRHIFYRPTGPINDRINPRYMTTDPIPLYPLVNLKTTPSQDATIWLTVLATFESIYYTLDFLD